MHHSHIYTASSKRSIEWVHPIPFRKAIAITLSIFRSNASSLWSGRNVFRSRKAALSSKTLIGGGRSSRLQEPPAFSPAQLAPHPVREALDSIVRSHCRIWSGLSLWAAISFYTCQVLCFETAEHCSNIKYFTLYPLNNSLVCNAF